MSPCGFRRYGPTNHFDTVGHVRVCRALHVWLQGRPPQIAAMAAQKKGDAGDVDDFFAFLQCQVHMEAKRQGCEASALPPTGVKIWQDVAPWIGRTGEKWVPYHLRLFGERILLELIDAEDTWDAWQRFVAKFVFHGHGRLAFFTEVQMPLMALDSFWQSPSEAFAAEGQMEAAFVSYRKRTGKPLLGGSYCQIPERLLDDDDWNLAGSIAQRT